MNFRFFSALGTVAALLCFASAPPARAAEYPLDGFDILQGVVVRAILRDTAGYTWLATDGGLWRWQRGGFALLDDILPLPGRPTCLLEDSKDVLWVGTIAGLVRVDSRTLRLLDETLLIAGKHIHCLFRDSGNRKWAGTSAGVYGLQDSAGATTPNLITSTQQYPIIAIAQGRGDALWLGTKGMLLELRNGSVTPSYRDLITPGHCQALLRSSDGALWVGVREKGKLLRIADQQVTTLTPEHGLTNPEINVIIEASGGTIWVATEDGVFHGNREQLAAIDQRNGLANSDVHALLCDYEDQIWIGTYGSGAFRLRGTGVLSYGIFDGLEHPYVRCLTGSADGTIVAGTVRSVQPFTTDGGFGPAIASGEQVAVVAVDPHGHIWFGHLHGIDRASPGLKFRLLNVMDMAFDESGALFVAANDGLWRLPPHPDETTEPQQLIKGNVNAVLPMPDGSVYAATNRELGRWKDQWEPVLAIPRVQAIARDGDRLWLGNSQGLYVWDGDPTATQIQRFDYEVRDIALQAGGAEGPGTIVWAATNLGVVSFNNGAIKVYGYEDGLPSRDVRCLFFDRSGHLFAGTTQGLAQLDTGNIPFCRASPKLAISAWSAGSDHGLVPIDGRDLTYDRRDIIIQIDALGWRSAEGLRFRYRLDGLDEDWTDYTRQDTRRYADLSPGTYTLNVQTINDRCVQSRVSQASFTVLAPFWQKGWFIALVLAAGLALAFGIVRFRARARQLSRDAATAAEAKADFLSCISHEIRSPLSIILLSAEGLIHAEPGSTNTTDYLDTIIRQGRHLLSVVNDVLDYSRIDKGEYTVDFVACNINYVIDDVRSLADYKLGDKQVELRVNIGPEVPRRVLIDPTALRQILINLMDNAVKFTQKGHISLSVSSPQWTAEQAVLRFEIADTGTGIPPDKRSRIFEAFKQAESSIARRFGGTGLGLTITKSLSQLLGGNLQLDSTPGIGTCFTFEIPVKIAPTEPPKRVAASTAPEEAHKLDGVRLLVADDCPDIRRVLERLLVRAGATVTTVEGGSEAVDAALCNEFDVIMLDLHMPGKDGFTVVASLHEHGIDTPLFAITADATEETQHRCVEVGFDAIITKPFDIQQLVTRIQELISPSPSTPGTSINQSALFAADRTASESWEQSDAAIRSSLAGESGGIGEAIVLFAGSLERSVLELQVRLKAKDTAAIAEVAHRLKGSGGINGYDCVSLVAARLEKDLAAKDWSAIGSTIQQMEDLSRRIRDGLSPGRAENLGQESTSTNG